jgi:hypothetical protein
MATEEQMKKDMVQITILADLNEVMENTNLTQDLKIHYINWITFLVGNSWEAWQEIKQNYLASNSIISAIQGYRSKLKNNENWQVDTYEIIDTYIDGDYEYLTHLFSGYTREPLSVYTVTRAMLYMENKGMSIEDLMKKMDKEVARDRRLLSFVQ